MIRHFIGTALIISQIWIWSGIFISSQNATKKYDFSNSNRASPVALAIGETAALYFLVDAFRRIYKFRKKYAWACAIFGALTFGITTVLYYLAWGRLPLKPKSEIYKNEFCTDCIAATTQDSAPNTVMFNGVTGTCLLGDSKPCPKCGSTIKTLWGFALVPIFPAGSFRVLIVSENTYITRRISIDWKNVFLTYVIGLALGGPILFYIIYNAWK